MLQYILTHDLDRFEEGEEDRGEEDRGEGGGGLPRRSASMSSAGGKRSRANSEEEEEEVRAFDGGRWEGRRGGCWGVCMSNSPSPPSLPPLPPSLPFQDEHPSLLLLLLDTLRVASASILLDLSQLPFLNVAICAMAGQGRLPALQVPPFQGYAEGFRAIVAAEVRKEGREERELEVASVCMCKGRPRQTTCPSGAAFPGLFGHRGRGGRGTAGGIGCLHLRVSAPLTLVTIESTIRPPFLPSSLPPSLRASPVCLRAAFLSA